MFVWDGDLSNEERVRDIDRVEVEAFLKRKFVLWWSVAVPTYISVLYQWRGEVSHVAFSFQEFNLPIKMYHILFGENLLTCKAPSITLRHSTGPRRIPGRGSPVIVEPVNVLQLGVTHVNAILRLIDSCEISGDEFVLLAVDHHVALPPRSHSARRAEVAVNGLGGALVMAELVSGSRADELEVVLSTESKARGIEFLAIRAVAAHDVERSARFVNLDVAGIFDEAASSPVCEHWCPIKRSGS